MASIFQGSNPHTDALAYSFSQTPQDHSAPRQHGFYPYTDNGGSTLGITGKDFTIIAGDTRSTSGYNINSRHVPKIFRIGVDDPESDDEDADDSAVAASASRQKTTSSASAPLVLAVVGFAADGHALKERLDAIVKTYRYTHGRPMGVRAAAQRLSTILYSKRFFPYYVHAILGGVDEEGKGALYSYDPVGSYERESCRAAGAAASLIMPFLDNQVKGNNQYVPGSGAGHELTAKGAEELGKEQVLGLVRDAFTSAVERHIEVGDGLQIMVISKEGVQEFLEPLKRD